MVQIGRRVKRRANPLKENFEFQWIPESTGQVLSHKLIYGHNIMGIAVHLDKPNMVEGDPKSFVGADTNYQELYPCVIWLDGEYDVIEEEVRWI